MADANQRKCGRISQKVQARGCSGSTPVGLPHPAIVTDDIHIAPYDVIFIGFPIWWYVAPTVINSFLEIHDFAGKKIVLFATSGGSGFGKAVAGLQQSAPQAEIAEGEIFNGFFSEEQIKAFFEKYV